MKSLFSQLNLNKQTSDSKIVRQLLTPEQIDAISGGMNSSNCSYTQQSEGSEYDQSCEVE